MKASDVDDHAASHATAAVVYGILCISVLDFPLIPSFALFLLLPLHGFDAWGGGVARSNAAAGTAPREAEDNRYGHERLSQEARMG